MICQRYNSVLSHQYQMFKVYYFDCCFASKCQTAKYLHISNSRTKPQGLISSPYYSCKQAYVWCISENRLPFCMTATQIIAWFRAPNIQITSAKNQEVSISLLTYHGNQKTERGIASVYNGEQNREPSFIVGIEQLGMSIFRMENCCSSLRLFEDTTQRAHQW